MKDLSAIPFGFAVALAAYNCEVFADKPLPKSEVLVSLMSQRFLSSFLEMHGRKFSAGTIEQFRKTYEQHGAAAVDQLLRAKIPGYEQKLLRTLRVCVKELGSRGAYVDHVARNYKLLVRK